MKKVTALFLFVVLCGFSSLAWDSDFSAVNSDGVTIYYNILSDSTNTVEVTRGGTGYSGSVNIPDTVTYDGHTYAVTAIGSDAFHGYGELTAVTLPNTLTTIGSNAFHGCNALTTITIPPSVTVIKEDAFNECSGLTSVTIPNSVTEIGNYAFYYCSSLASVTIGDSVTSIGSNVLRGTPWYGVSSNWTDDMLYCGHYLLEAKNTLTGSHTIKGGTTCIARKAFLECRELAVLTIPRSMTHIGSYAFKYCDVLTSITSLNPNPPVAGRAFWDMNEQDAVLHVLAGSEDSYAAAAGWCDFHQILGDADSTTVGIERMMDDADVQLLVRNGEIVLANEQGAPVQVFNIAGVLVYSGRPYGESHIAVPQRGLYIVRAGNAPAKKVVVM